MSGQRIWIVYTNTDITEGRGYDIPFAYCEAEITAKRLAKGCHVQGCDGPIKQLDTVTIEGEHYLPLTAIHVQRATKEDIREQAALDAKNAAMKKVMAAGLTEEDLRALGIVT